MPAIVEQEPQSYSPDNPFAPKAGPQPKGYSPDNPFAPKPSAAVATAPEPQLPRRQLLAGLRNVGLTTEEPGTAPLDESRVGAAPANPQARQLTGKAKFASDVFSAGATPFEHPAETTVGMVTAPAKAAKLLAEAGVDYAAGRPITTSPKDLAIAAAQVGSLAIAGPAEEAIGELIAPYIGSRAAGLLARTTVASGVGAAYNPEHPGVGAVVGGTMGAALNEASPMRPTVRRLVTDNPARMLPDETTPRAPTATGRVTEAAPLPNEPDFTVEQNAPSTYSPDNPFAPSAERTPQIPNEAATPHEVVGKPAENSETATHSPDNPFAQPEKTDLFGNAVAPTVEQGGLFAAGAGSEQSRRDQQQLARKDEAISPEEMTQRREELGAPKPASEQPKKTARRKPVEGAVNPKYRLDDTDALLDRAAELEARLEEHSSGEHGSPEFVREQPDNVPIVGGTHVRQRLAQDAELYRGVMDELNARGVDQDAIDEGLAKRGRTPLAGSTASDDTPFARVAPKAPGPATPKQQPNAAPAPNVAPPAAAAPPREEGAFDEIKGAITPGSATPEAGHSARITRANLGEFAHNFEQARHQWKPLSKIFRTIGPQKSLEAYDRAERGNHTTAKEDLALKQIQGKLREVANAIHALGPGHLDSFIDNYLAHIYEDPKKATAVMQALGRRPLEGSRSFQKQRTIPTLKDAMAQGLKPKTWNPVDLNLLKLREMYKYLAAQKIIAEHKDAGLYQFVPATTKAPEGYDRINDHVAMVYGPPHVVIKEAFDSVVRQKLNDVIDNLPNLTHDRPASLGRGKAGALGYARSSGDYMATRFAGPDGVIMHELGHILDARYGLYAKLATGKGAAELRELAKLRHEGQPANPKFEKYVQLKEEQTANAVHALLYVPDRMAQVAPTVKARLEQFLKSKPELAPLLDIKPSLVFDEAETTKAVGGLVLRGQYWAPKDVARILNNYLSPGLRGRSKVYDRVAGVGAMLNQAQLGLSGYHALFTSVDATVSQAAVALQNLVAGRVGKAAAQMAEIPVAPVTNFLRGRKLLKAYLDLPNAPPEMKKYVQALIDGGGRVKMDDFYKSGAIQKMLDAFGEALHGAAMPASSSGRQLAQRGTAAAKGAAYGVPALFELLAKPIMEVVVPAQKLGVFANLAEHELATLPKQHTVDDERLAYQKAWQSVDNRLGQVVYDNMFWNRTGKDLAHLTIRSVGWNYGSLAELGGGAVDIGRIVNDALHGREPNFTPRAAYLLMLPVIVGLIDALIQYLRTKDAPGWKNGKWMGTKYMLKDLYYPRTGQQDKYGNDDRQSIPSYMKDVVAYGMHTGQTLINKLHPELATIAQMIQNKDFYGDEIHNPDDPFWKRRQQDLAYAKDQFLPLGVRNAREQVKREDGPFRGGVSDYAKAVVSNPKQLVGVTPAPREIVRTPAQNRMNEYLARRGHTEQTPEEKEQRVERQAKRAELLSLPRSEQRTEVRAMIKSKEVTARQGMSLLTRSGEHPLVSNFKQLSPDEALRVWKDAEPWEKDLWRKWLAAKLTGAGRRAEIPPDAQKPK